MAITCSSLTRELLMLETHGMRLKGKRSPHAISTGIVGGHGSTRQSSSRDLVTS